MPTATLETTWEWAGEALPGGAERWSGYDGRRVVFATLQPNTDRTRFALTNEGNGHAHQLGVYAGGVACSCEAIHGRCWHRELVAHAAANPPRPAPVRRCLYCRRELPAWVSAEWPICPRCRDIAAAEDARALEVTP